MHANNPQAPLGAATCQLLTIKDLSSLLKRSERECWRQTVAAEAGLCKFPLPLRLGPKTVRWRFLDVQSYIDALVKQAAEAAAGSR